MQIKAFDDTTREFLIDVGTQEVHEIHNMAQYAYEATTLYSGKDGDTASYFVALGFVAAIELKRSLQESPNSQVRMKAKDALAISDMFDFLTGSTKGKIVIEGPFDKKKAQRIARTIYNGYLREARYDKSQPIPVLRPDINHS